MADETEEKVRLEVQLTARESPELRKVTHKANASLSEDEVLSKNTIGSLEDDDKQPE